MTSLQKDECRKGVGVMQNTYERFLNTLDTNSASFASYYGAIGDADYSE